MRNRNHDRGIKGILLCFLLLLTAFETLSEVVLLNGYKEVYAQPGGSFNNRVYSEPFLGSLSHALDFHYHGPTGGNSDFLGIATSHVEVDEISVGHYLITGRVSTEQISSANASPILDCAAYATVLINCRASDAKQKMIVTATYTQSTSEALDRTTTISVFGVTGPFPVCRNCTNVTHYERPLEFGTNMISFYCSANQRSHSLDTSPLGVTIVFSVELEFTSASESPGFSPRSPAPPSQSGVGQTGGSLFTNAPTATWFAMPNAESLEFVASAGSLFSRVDFPPGGSSPLVITLDKSILGVVQPGASFDFSSVPAVGQGVPRFQIHTSEPSLPASLYLRFTQPNISFSVTPITPVFSFACLTAPTGVISWWGADGDARDRVSTNHGVLNGGVTFEKGILGDAFHFDGPTNYITARNESLTNTSDNFTVEFWAYPRAGSGITPEVISGTAGTKGQRYAIFPDHGGDQAAGMGVSVGTNGIAVFEHGGNYLPSTLVYSAAILGWNHVAIVYKNKQPLLYLNGALVRTGLMSPRQSVHPSAQFGGSSLPYGPFIGGLDEMTVYNRSLGAAEVKQLYEAGVNGKCASPLRFEITSGSPVVSGSSFNLKLAGLPGQIVSLETTLDFKTWLPLATNVLENLPLLLVQPAEGTARFYRATHP